MPGCGLTETLDRMAERPVRQVICATPFLDLSIFVSLLLVLFRAGRLTFLPLVLVANSQNQLVWECRASDVLPNYTVLCVYHLPSPMLRAGAD